MRFHHILGGFVLAFAAAGLGVLAAYPILLQLERPNDAQAALEIGLLFFVPFVAPALLTLYAIAKGAQERRLRAAIDQHGPALLRRYTLHTKPNQYGLADVTRWSDEVWQFRRALPLRLPLLNHAAVLRIVTERMTEIAAYMTPSRPSAFADQPAFARCIGADLIRLGWRAKLLAGKSPDDVHILAEKNKVRVVIVCRPHGPVTNADVQRAVKARGHTGADLAAIIANDDFSAAARALARHTRVGLLNVTQTADLHRAAGRFWRKRKAPILRRTPAVANAHR